MRDEDYLAKQIEVQVGFRKTLLHKFNVAKDLHEAAIKVQEAAKERAKIEAYNNWRIQEEEKAKVQEERTKNLARIMKEAVKTGPCSPIEAATSNVLLNMDGNIMSNLLVQNWRCLPLHFQNNRRFFQET